MARIDRVVAVAIGLVLLPCGQAAAFESARLIYLREQGAEHYPEELVVRQAVTSRLGYDPFAAEAERTIVARIRVVSGRLSAYVELLDAEGSARGRRQLSTSIERCDELVFALALSISIAVDPELAERSESEPEVVAAAPVAAKRSRQASALAAAPQKDAQLAAEPDSERVVLYAGAGGHAVSGTLPVAAGGAFLLVGGRLHRLSLTLETRADGPVSFELEGGARITSSLLLASLAPCVHHQSLFACAVGSAGVLRAGSSNVSTPRDDSGVYAAAGVDSVPNRQFPNLCGCASTWTSWARSCGQRWCSWENRSGGPRPCQPRGVSAWWRIFNDGFPAFAPIP